MLHAFLCIIIVLISQMVMLQLLFFCLSFNRATNATNAVVSSSLASASQQSPTIAFLSISAWRCGIAYCMMRLWRHMSMHDGKWIIMWGCRGVGWLKSPCPCVPLSWPCPEGIFWTAQPFVTKLCVVVHHSEVECHVIKNKQKNDCYFQSQFHRTDNYNI